MVTVEQVLFALGSSLLVVCSWALAKVYERDAEDRKAAKKAIHSLRNIVQKHGFRITVVERHLDIEPIVDSEDET